MIDLLLGGKMGMWVLDNVGRNSVRVVISKDQTIRQKALQLNMPSVRAVTARSADKGMRDAISVHYPKVLTPFELGQYRTVYNLHPGYLPWGRGMYPVFWALWDDEPAGCTLHVMDDGIDTGPIVDRQEVAMYGWDTGGTLHQRVTEAEKGMFLKWWPIIAGDVVPEFEKFHDANAPGSFHTKADFMQLKYGLNVAGKDLLKLIRCLSHPDYTGLEIRFENRLYEISARPI